jgi:apolipoprotein N-acyltransferase
VLNWLLAFATAALLVLSFPGWNLAWLAPLALAPLIAGAAREPRPLRRFLMGWTAGVAYWFGVCYWIQNVLASYGGVGNVGGWALFTLFAVVKALHLGVFALAAGVVVRRWWAVPAVAALWVALEFTHGYLGFAWLALGNAGIDMGVPMRLAPITGVWGLSFIFAAMATTVAIAAVNRPRLHLLGFAVVLPLAFAPPLPPAARGNETALLVQPNLSESEQWTPESLDRMMRRLAGLTLQGVLREPVQPPSIAVWPEVPAPFYYDQDERFHNLLDNLAQLSHAYLLVGVVGHERDGSPLNSALLISSAGAPVSRYDKVNLVPFGEFVPWPFGWLTKKISTEAGDFAAGRRVVVSRAGRYRLGVFICYESVFPNFVRRFAADGAEVLFNISNDGWFGKTAARRQHLAIVRMRAAENRRWILRSTNDGITAVIDSAGRLRGTLPPFVEATSYSGFETISSRTFYTRWGDWFAAVCATIALASLLAERVL